MKKQLETIKNSRADTENELKQVREKLSDVKDNLAVAQSKVTEYEEEKNQAVRRKVRQDNTLEELGRKVDNSVEISENESETAVSEAEKAPKESDESDNSNEGNTVGNMTKKLIELAGYKKLRY